MAFLLSYGRQELQGCLDNILTLHRKGVQNSSNYDGTLLEDSSTVVSQQELEPIQCLQPEEQVP